MCYFELKIHTLWFWGHLRLILYLVKMGIPFKDMQFDPNYGKTERKIVHIFSCTGQCWAIWLITNCCFRLIRRKHPKALVFILLKGFILLHYLFGSFYYNTLIHFLKMSFFSRTEPEISTSLKQSFRFILPIYILKDFTEGFVCSYSICLIWDISLLKTWWHFFPLAVDSTVWFME